MPMRFSSAASAIDVRPPQNVMTPAELIAVLRNVLRSVLMGLAPVARWGAAITALLRCLVYAQRSMFTIRPVNGGAGMSHGYVHLRQGRSGCQCSDGAGADRICSGDVRPGRAVPDPWDDAQ